MTSGRRGVATVVIAAAGVLSAVQSPRAQDWPRLFLPEQRCFSVRDPSQLPHARLPDTSPPPTVSEPQAELPARNLSLDEALRIALDQSAAVRVLAGVTAVASGRTIYDTAIANTEIDAQRARFDPSVRVNNGWNRTESPEAVFHPLTPGQAQIQGLRSDAYNLDVGVSKQTLTGGQVDFGINAAPTRLQPGTFPLNPSTRSSVDLSYTQPLLQGGGLAANLAPLVIARIDTERSYFQFKDAMQEYVRGVIEAYWSLVFARTDVWTRQRQVEQADYAFRLADGGLKVGIKNAGDVAQARVAVANFRASLVASEANSLQREAALRNILGLPPADGLRLVPVSLPATDRLEPEWRGLLALAEERRPDLIELKLIIEADQQFLLQSQNQALPRVDAVASYRWNGLEGEMPNGDRLRSPAGQYTDWGLGVNFSVPLGIADCP
jgi:outer membrane protein TolC